MSSDIDRIYEMLGVRPPQGHTLSTDDPPLAVDESKLRAFHNRTLDHVSCEEVAFLIAHYQSWWDADLCVSKELLRELTNEPEQQMASLRLGDHFVGKKRYAAIAAIAATLLVAAFFLFRPNDVVHLADGRFALSIGNEGEVSGLENYPPQVRSEVRQALAGRLPFPPEEDYTGYSPPIVVRSEGNLEVRLVTPINTTIETERPVFEWEEIKGIRSYIVTVRGPAEKEVTSPEVQGTQWQMDEALDRGETYDWSVRPSDAQAVENVLPARFRVAAERELAQAGEARQRFHDSPLTLLITYTQLGMFELAEEQLARLTVLNQGSKLVDQLRQVLKNHRRSEREDEVPGEQ